MSLILGISAYYHDSAVVLIDDDKIISAVQEERLSRVKNDQSFPILAIKNILDSNKLSLNDVDAVVFYEKPLIKFERIIETILFNAPRGFKNFRMSFPIWIKEKLFLKNTILNELKTIDPNFNNSKIKFSSHHLSHASSAFFPSPYEKAIILTIDGVGEWSTTTIGLGNGSEIKIVKELRYPNSLGLLYSAFTYFLGFKVNSGEYKLMGLSPYGKPKYSKLIFDNLINLNDDGSFSINQKYFSYSKSDRMINKKFCDLFGILPKNPSEEFTQAHLDIASSIQEVLNHVVTTIVKNAYREYKIDYLCLSGGVALNCITNYEIQKMGIFKGVWIQPASGDAGGALGAAMAYKYLYEKKIRKINNEDSMSRSLLGPSYEDNQIQKLLEDFGLNYNLLANDIDLVNQTVEILKEGKFIGFFQGRMEYGPRSLGSRSILADPRGTKVQKKLNLNIKFRESFRPFAPAILANVCHQYFDNDQLSPYMLSTYKIKDKYRKEFNSINLKTINEIINEKKSDFPAITHVDYSSRVQTVDRFSNKIFYELLNKFYKDTGCPILLNTSFNVRGEPIVCSPSDAINCFMKTNLDYLVIGRFIVKRPKEIGQIKFLINKALD